MLVADVEKVSVVWRDQNSYITLSQRLIQSKTPAFSVKAERGGEEQKKSAKLAEVGLVKEAISII